MKPWLAALLLLLALTGCRAEALPAPSVPERLAPTKETENDILRCCPLGGAECRFFAFGDKLGLVWTKEHQTELLLCEGKNGTVTTHFPLPDSDCCIQSSGNQILCYHPKEEACTVLDSQLWPVRRERLPGAEGTPLLASDGSIFYRTDSAVMVLEPDSGLHRMLRDGIDADWVTTALTRGETALASSQGILLSTIDGRELGRSSPVLAASHFGAKEWTALSCGDNVCLTDGNTLLPLVPGFRFLGFWPDKQCALVCRTEGNPELILYDLNTGSRRDTLTGGFSVPTQAVILSDGRVFFHTDGEDRFWQWITGNHPGRDSRIRLCRSEEDGIDQLRQKAGFLAEKYGITLSDGSRSPGTEPEPIAALRLNGLERIEKSLDKLPTDFVRQIFRGAGHTTLFPVRSIRGRDCEQIWNGRDSMVYLTVNERVGDSAIRCLLSMMESRILSDTDYYDSWDSEIPPETERADLFLAAIAPENRDHFRSAVLQNKLRRMCLAIRAVYQLPQNPLLWEQYLWEPVVLGG